MLLATQAFGEKLLALRPSGGGAGAAPPLPASLAPAVAALRSRQQLAVRVSHIFLTCSRRITQPCCSAPARNPVLIASPLLFSRFQRQRTDASWEAARLAAKRSGLSEASRASPGGGGGATAGTKRRRDGDGDSDGGGGRRPPPAARRAGGGGALAQLSAGGATGEGDPAEPLWGAPAAGGSGGGMRRAGAANPPAAGADDADPAAPSPVQAVAAALLLTGTPAEVRGRRAGTHWRNVPGGNHSFCAFGN